MANIIISIIHMLLGILWIWFAINDFKKANWVSFATDIMCTVWSSTFMILNAIEWYFS